MTFRLKSHFQCEQSFAKLMNLLKDGLKTRNGRRDSSGDLFESLGQNTTFKPKLLLSCILPTDSITGINCFGRWYVACMLFAEDPYH